MNDFKNLTLKEIEEMGHEAIQKGEKWKVRVLIYLLICRIGEKSDDFINGTARRDEIANSLKGSVYYRKSDKRKSRSDSNRSGGNGNKRKICF